MVTALFKNKQLVDLQNDLMRIWSLPAVADFCLKLSVDSGRDLSWPVPLMLSFKFVSVTVNNGLHTRCQGRGGADAMTVTSSPPAHSYIYFHTLL